MDSYWDLYVAYVHYCVEYNRKHDIDPHHYEMEWNHFLPQCLFGDQPIGQYLLLKQHAIASALQTLAFKTNCMCGWHKKYLPAKLIELAWPHYCESHAGKNNPMHNKKVIWTDDRRQNQSEKMTGNGNPMYGKTGELNPMFGVKRPEHADKLKGRKRPEISKGMTGAGNHCFGKKWWVNAKGETSLQAESPGPEWQRGMKWKNIKEESPCAE